MIWFVVIICVLAVVWQWNILRDFSRNRKRVMKCLSENIPRNVQTDTHKSVEKWYAIAAAYKSKLVLGEALCLFVFTIALGGVAFGQRVAVDFKGITDDIFEIHFKNWSAEVDVLERDAKLVRARIWPGFTNLLAAEIDTGTAGSYVKIHEVSLYVFDVCSTNGSPLLVKSIRETEAYMDEKAGHRVTNLVEQNPYRLLITNGLPMVLWTKTGRTTVICYTNASRKERPNGN